MANAVKFVYVAAGKQLPSDIDRQRNTIYFVEDKQQIWVGDKLFADHIDPVDLDAYMRPYKVKSVQILGEGTYISDAQFDEATGSLSLTRTTPSPTVERGVDGEATDSTLKPGDSFTAVTSVSVADNKIYTDRSKFVLPAQIKGVSIEKTEDSGNKLILKITSTDGTDQTAELTMFGSASFKNADDFATKEQGKKADDAMQADNGTATNAHVSLAEDPQSEMDAATKKYVDEATTGLKDAMHFLGESDTAITDGGREHPHIKGTNVDTSTISPGDTVVYKKEDGTRLEFIWTMEDEMGVWSQLGNEDVVGKQTKVEAGDGLSGGGALDQNVTLSHGETGPGEDKELKLDGEGQSVITGIFVDKFGHTKSVSSANLNDLIQASIELAVSGAISKDKTIAHIEDIPAWQVIVP